MKKMNFIKKIIPFLIITIFTLACLPKICANDLFFDIKTGEDILTYGIDFKDHFSFIQGLIYMYPHWLYNIIIYIVFHFFNYNGLLVFFCFFYTLFGFLLYKIIRKHTNNSIISIIVTLYVVIISRNFFSTRVQSITYLLFLLEIFFLEELYKKGKRKYIFLLILNSIIIANIHMPIWIFSIVLMLPFVAEYVFYILKEKFCIVKKLLKNIPIEKPKSAKCLISCFCFMIFSGLITPLKLYSYTYFTKSLFNDSLFKIDEMKNTVLIEHPTLLKIILLFLIILYFKLINVKLRDYFMFLGIFIFSLMANRNIVFVFFIFIIIIMKSLNYDLIIYINKKIDLFLKKMNITLISIILLLISFVGNVYVVNYVYSKDFNYGIDNTEYPVESTKYIIEKIDYKNSKIYTEYDFGSYLAFYNIPVFIDSRAEVYDSEFNGGYSILDDFRKIRQFENYKEIFEKYDFDYALVFNKSSLYYYLSSDLDYIILYEDTKFALFEHIKYRNYITSERSD